MSSQAAFDEAVATIQQASALELRWKNAGRSDAGQLEEILRLYGQSVQKLNDAMADGALNAATSAKLSEKRAEISARIETLKVRRPALTLRSGSGSAHKDAVATLKEGAAMDARVKNGERGLLVDTVRLYSHAIRLMLRAISVDNCKQELQEAMQQKIVDARKRIAILSANSDDSTTLRAALDRDAAQFPDLAGTEPNLEAKPMQPSATDAPGQRWCKKCQVVFDGVACSKGHPNFLYSRKLPAIAEDADRPSSGSTSAPAAVTSSARRWGTDVEQAAHSPKPSTTEAQSILQEQARLQQIKAAEAKKKRAERRLRRLSNKPSDDPSVAAAERQAAVAVAAVAALEGVQESVPPRTESPVTVAAMGAVHESVPERTEPATSAQHVDVQAWTDTSAAEEPIEETVADAQAIAALMRERLAAKKKAEKETAEWAEMHRQSTPHQAAAVNKTIVPMVDIGMIRAINPNVKITQMKVAGVRAAIREGAVEVAVGGTLQVAESGDASDLSADAKERAVTELRKTRTDPRVVNRLRVAKATAEEKAQAALMAVATQRAERERQALADAAATKTIVPMVDIGMIRAINPNVKITQMKVAGVRAAIREGAVEVAVGGTLQVAESGDASDLSADAKERAVTELRKTRTDPRVVNRLRVAKATAEEEAQAALVAVATQRAERERQALADAVAAREKAAAQRQAEVAAEKVRRAEDRKLKQEKAKAKAAKAAAAAAAAKEQEDRARELAREQQARELAAAAAAARQKPLLPTNIVAFTEPSAPLQGGKSVRREDSPQTTGLLVSAEAIRSGNIPRIELRHSPLPLADLAAQPPPRQYLRDAVGPAVVASVAKLARASSANDDDKLRGATSVLTPEKGVATLLSRLLLSPPPPLSGPENVDAETAKLLFASGAHSDGWRSTVRPLLQSSLSQLDLERPHDRTEATQFVARTLRSMGA